MKSIRLIRHAESAANAGLRTSDPGEIPLTDKGKAAAELAALEYDGPPPELIVVSPYLRARQTAAPFITRFPEAKVDATWPVHEFTYISPERCVGSTFDERKPMVAAYWGEASPEYVDGPQSESFKGFIGRVTDSLANLRERKEATILVVCHGIFMNAAEFYQRPTENPANPESMRRFHHYTLEYPVPNLGVLDFTDRFPREQKAGDTQFEPTRISTL
jgi:probable phosphoglycerate mutase